MKRWRQFVRCAVCLLLGCANSSALAEIEVEHYFILSGGEYTYKPSPFIGIPGCSPSRFECDFGIAGNFGVEYDGIALTAKFIDLNLVLTGNEVVQNNPPALETVTSDRITNYLANRNMHLLPTGSIQYGDTSNPGLKLFRSLPGGVVLTGGFDITFVDGNAMLFQLSAVPVPEPATAVVFSLTAASIALNSRCRRATPANRR